MLNFWGLTQKSFYTEDLLHKKPFTQKSFYTEELLHKKPFTQKSFYTEELLHRGACTQKSFYTRNLLHRRAFKAIWGKSLGLKFEEPALEAGTPEILWLWLGEGCWEGAGTWFAYQEPQAFSIGLGLVKVDFEDDEMMILCWGFKWGG